MFRVCHESRKKVKGLVANEEAKLSSSMVFIDVGKKKTNGHGLETAKMYRNTLPKSPGAMLLTSSHRILTSHQPGRAERSNS